MKWILYDTRGLFFSFKSSKLRFFGSDALGKGIEGGGVIMENFFIDFFHVSEHVDHFKAIKVFSLRKKPEMVWLGGTPPPGVWQKTKLFPVFSCEGFPMSTILN